MKCAKREKVEETPYRRFRFCSFRLTVLEVIMVLSVSWMIASNKSSTLTTALPSCHAGHYQCSKGLDLSPDGMKTHRISKVIHVKSVLGQNYPVYVTWTLRECVSELRCYLYHLTAFQNYEVHCQ
ncbi:hypothetical protein TNCV_3085201 [Trichonephila clavipes]|nr:hypothetical protein TNCV_3085201 [Trichonephila clavipes]